MARPRRAIKDQCRLYDSPTSLDRDGIRVTHRVSVVKGNKLVAMGKAISFVDYDGQVAFQRVEAPARVIRPSDPSRAALGPAEMKANAGLFGPSRTKGMSEPDRRGRVHPLSGRALPEEDFVERVQILVGTYTASANFHDIKRKRRGLAPGGDRAMRVYPRVN